MIRRLLPVLLLCGIAAAQIEPLIQTISNNTQSCAFPQNVVSGNTLIVVAHSEGTLTGISDTRTSTWTLQESGTSTQPIVRIWTAPAASSGADTVTVTGVNSFNGITCMEFDSSLVSATKDVSANGSYAASPASITMSSLTTTVNGDFLIGGISGFQNVGVLQPVLPLIEGGQTNSSDSQAVGYKYTAVSGAAYNGVFNNVSNTQGSYVILALKPVAIAITDTALPTGSLTNSYSYCMSAVGGAGAYTWSLSSGALPSGVTINAGSGCITGTPTGGTASPTIQVTDGTNTITKALTLTVNNSANSISFINSGSASPIAAYVLPSVNLGDVIVFGETSTQLGQLSLCSPVDNLSTPYKYLGTVPMTNRADENISLYVGKTISGGTPTITLCPVTSPGSVTWAIFRNAQLFYDAVGFVVGSSASSATLTGPSITTGAPNSEIWGYTAAFTSATVLAAVAPFTTATASTAPPALGEYNNEVSAGSYTPQATQTGNTGLLWLMAALALRPTTTGPVATGVRRHKTPIF